MAASTAFPICRTYGLGNEIDFVAPSVDDRVTIEVIDELDSITLLMAQHLAVYREHAPGFAGAYLMLSAPQPGASLGRPRPAAAHA